MKTGGYTMVLYLIDWLGPSSEVMDWLTKSVGRSLQYDDRKTALEWCGQILAALKDYMETAWALWRAAVDKRKEPL